MPKDDANTSESTIGHRKIFSSSNSKGGRKRLSENIKISVDIDEDIAKSIRKLKKNSRTTMKNIVNESLRYYFQSTSAELSSGEYEDIFQKLDGKVYLVSQQQLDAQVDVIGLAYKYMGLMESFSRNLAKDDKNEFLDEEFRKLGSLSKVLLDHLDPTELDDLGRRERQRWSNPASDNLKP